MEDPQGLELTGTNWPTQTTTPPPTTRYGAVKQRKQRCASTIRSRTNPNTNPPNNRVGIVYGPTRRLGGHSGGATPGPIPNPEAKTPSADGTAPARVWESRTPPSTQPKEGSKAPHHPPRRGTAWCGASPHPTDTHTTTDTHTASRAPTPAPPGPPHTPNTHTTTHTPPKDLDDRLARVGVPSCSIASALTTGVETLEA